MSNESRTTFSPQCSSLMTHYLLAIYFAEHDIHRAQDDDRVGYVRAAHHLRQGHEITVARAPHLHPVGVVPAPADEVDAQVAAGVLAAHVDLAGLGPDEARHLADHRAVGEAVETLFDDPDRLPHFHHAYPVAVEAVAVVRYGNLEVQ